jgi:hypothetical protein
MDRQKAALANLEADIWAADFNGTVDAVERHGDGYTIRLRCGSRTFVRSGIGAAVLEDELSTDRQRLVAEARAALLAKS